MCPNTCFSRTNYSLSRYNVKGELDFFNCKAGVFLRLNYLLQHLQKKAITIHVFARKKKSTRLWGIFSSCKEIKN